VPRKDPPTARPRAQLETRARIVLLTRLRSAKGFFLRIGIVLRRTLRGSGDAVGHDRSQPGRFFASVPPPTAGPDPPPLSPASSANGQRPIFDHLKPAPERIVKAKAVHFHKRVYQVLRQAEARCVSLFCLTGEPPLSTAPRCFRLFAYCRNRYLVTRARCFRRFRETSDFHSARRPGVFLNFERRSCRRGWPPPRSASRVTIGAKYRVPVSMERRGQRLFLPLYRLRHCRPLRVSGSAQPRLCQRPADRWLFSRFPQPQDGGVTIEKAIDHWPLSFLFQHRLQLLQPSWAPVATAPQASAGRVERRAQVPPWAISLPNALATEWDESF